MNITEWDGKIDLNEDITGTLQSVFHELTETAVSRSPFQLARFVVHSHGTLKEGAGPIMRQQALREIETCMEGITRARINIERLERKNARLNQTKPEDFDLEIAENVVTIRREIISLMRKFREYRVLQAILEELPQYSWQEFNELEPKRWANRLLRQCDEYHESLIQGLDRGDYQAIKQARSKDVLPEIGFMLDEHVTERYSLGAEPPIQIGD